MAPPLRHGFMKQSDTLGGWILIPLTVSVLFCHLQSERRRAERKVCLFAFVSFFVPACLACHFSGALCCCCCRGCCIFYFFPSGVVCFISRAIWLVSEPNFAPVSPRSPLLPEKHTHIHIFPRTDTLPSHSKQINSSPATV